MTFPNACASVKKLHKALTLGVVALIFNLVADIFSYGNEDSPLVLVSLVLLIAAGVISLVTYIMGISAAKKGEPDEKNFKTAYTALIVGVVAIIVMYASSSFSKIISNIGSSVNALTIFVAQYFIITAIINLAERLGDTDIRNSGIKVRSALIVLGIIRVILQVVGIFPGLGTLSAVVSSVADCIGIVVAIMCLIYLGKVRVILEK